MSGIELREGVKEHFDDFKSGSRQHRLITFRVSPNYKEIIIDDNEKFQVLKTNPKSKEAQDAIDDTVNVLKGLCENLVDDKQPKWIFVSYDFRIGAEQRPTDKIVLIKWSPDGAVVKQKMVWSSSTNVFKSSIDFQGLTVQCDDIADIQGILGDLKSGKLKG